MRAVDCKEGLGFAQPINVAGYCVIFPVSIQMTVVVLIEVDRETYQVGQGHSQIHERDVEKDLSCSRSSFLEENVGEDDDQRTDDGETARHAHHGSHKRVLWKRWHLECFGCVYLFR